MKFRIVPAAIGVVVGAAIFIGLGSSDDTRVPVREARACDSATVERLVLEVGITPEQIRGDGSSPSPQLMWICRDANDDGVADAIWQYLSGGVSGGPTDGGIILGGRDDADPSMGLHIDGPFAAISELDGRLLVVNGVLAEGDGRANPSAYEIREILVKEEDQSLVLAAPRRVDPDADEVRAPSAFDER